MEQWRPINGWYDVSDRGRVRSWKRNRWGRRAVPRILRPDLTAKHGYPRVNIQGVVRYVHHLVLEAFSSTRPRGHEGAHRDGNKRNNTLANLYWATPQQNGADNARLGVSKGVLHGQAKLTDDDVRAIRASKKLHREIAEEFGVTSSNVSRIRARKAWSHVT